MTKKDYEAAAVAFRCAYAVATTPEQVQGVDFARREMESVFRADNGRFDVERFRARVEAVKGGR